MADTVRRRGGDGRRDEGRTPDLHHGDGDGGPVPEKLSSKEYERELRHLQAELLKLQRHVVDSGAKVVVIFEGRDAAGKGGAIRRFTEHLNPRSARIVALPKPTDTERGQWCFQR